MTEHEGSGADGIVDETTPLLAAALRYAGRGWSVLPVYSAQGSRCACGSVDCGSPGKHPRTLHGLKNATADKATIRAWWQQWPGASVGIATGAVSGLVVLDVDPRHDGDRSLWELEDRHGKIPHSVEALTGGGGRHILFGHPLNGVIVRNVTALGGLPGLDVRGDGGYIGAPPSIHSSGRAYEWEASSHPDDVPLASTPPWLLDMLRRSPAGSGVPAPGTSTADWRALVAQGVEEGRRNQAVAALAGHLLRRGIDPFVTLHLVIAWNTTSNRPPLLAEEVARTVNSIAGAELRRRQRGRGSWMSS
jgi:hypothetical protein